MKIAVKINLAKDGFILCKLLGFTPQEIAQYYVNQVSFEKFKNKNIAANIAATSFFMRNAAGSQKRQDNKSKRKL